MKLNACNLLLAHMVFFYTVAENNHDRSRIDSPDLLLGDRTLGSIA
jgi:hypothetical protein